MVTWATILDRFKRDAKKAEKSLTPELINRLDEIIVFNYFSKEHIKTFFQKEIKELKIKLKKIHGITLDVDEKMVDYLTELAYNRKQGARPVRRIIQKNIENIASKWIINENKGTLKITKKIIMTEKEKSKHQIATSGSRVMEYNEVDDSYLHKFGRSLKI